ncbi:hypothetical protein D3C80_1706840 [compost metagenome]
MEGGLRQGHARHAELVDLAGEALAQNGRTGRQRARDLAGRLTIDEQGRLLAVVDQGDMGPGSGRKRSARAARTGGVEEQGRAFRRQGQTRQGQQLTVRTRLDPEADRDRPLRKGFGRQ